MASPSSSVSLIDVEGGTRTHRRPQPFDWFSPRQPYSSPSPLQQEKEQDIDTLLKETGDSPAWQLYNNAAKEVDERLVKDWKSKLEGILLFAALFASVIISLLISTMSLLEPSNLDRTEALLYFLAQQTVSPVNRMPEELVPGYIGPPYRRPHWAFVINGLLISSLTFSILVGLGAIICLEWINEYEDTSSMMSTPKKQALRRHFRFKSVNAWHMARLISALPFMMFLVVMLFFVAMMVWLWRIDRFLAMLPMLGVGLTGTMHLLTTTLTVVFPSSPYKTSVSYALFQIVTFVGVFIWFFIEVIPIWWRFWLDRLKSGLRNQAPDVVRRSYAMNWARSKHEWKDRVHKVYPWLPRGLQLSDAISMQRREDAVVSQDETLRLSALAWIANSLELSIGSHQALVDILKEVNKLDKHELEGWGAFEYEAPWGEIFRIVLAGSSSKKPANNRSTEMELIIAELLEKIMVNQTLFSSIIRKINQTSLVNLFVGSLVANKAESEDTENRLRGMTTLLSSFNIRQVPRTEWPLRGIFRVLADSMQYRGQRTDAHFTSWIFPLCKHDESTCDIHDSRWPDDNYIDFADSFSSRRCRIDAIFRFMMWIDSTEKEGKCSPEDIQVIFKLLIDHILVIHWAFEAPPFARDRPPPFIESGFDDPALNLVNSTIATTYSVVACPDDWSPHWQSAVKYWCRWKRLVKLPIVSDDGYSEIDFLCKIWSQDLEDGSIFAESIGLLEERVSTLPPHDWDRIFENLSQVTIPPMKLTPILGLFNQALQSTVPGRSFGQRLKSRILTSSKGIAMGTSQPGSPTSPTKARRPGSFQRRPRRQQTLEQTLGENDFRPSPLFRLMTQSLGSYKPGDGTQQLLRTVCMTIIQRLMPLDIGFGPGDVAILADLQEHLRESARNNDMAAQACLDAIGQKLRGSVPSNNSLPLTHRRLPQLPEARVSASFS